MNDTTRTFTARYTLSNDGRHFDCAHTITVTGYGTELRFEIDGQPASAEQAADIRAKALDYGTWERLSGPEMQPIGKTVACRLHLDLARLGVARHYQIAGEALGYPVSTLAALTRQESQDVWSYACGLAERPTLPSIVFQGVGT